MTRKQVVDWLEGIVFGGVAITAAALQHATEGQEVSFIQWRALLLVGEDEAGCRVGEVAGFLQAALPTTSRLLRRLERRGLLTLERDEGDRRATRARLTPAGTDLRASVLSYRRSLIATIADAVDPPAAAHRALHDLAARFDALGHAPPGPRDRPSDSEAAR